MDHVGRRTGAARIRLSTSVATALAVAVVLALLPVPVAAQEPERGLDHACPDGVPRATFTDIDDNVHTAAIDCLLLYGITEGIGGGRYGPGGSVRRDQMASFVLRLLGIAGMVLPPETGAPFPDVAPDSVHADAIGQLAALGIVGGFADGTFRPAAPVRRDQMTAFLNRAYAEVAGQPLLARQRFFTDTAGNTHEDDINALAGAGVAVGAGDGTFGPGRSVRRDQMASFVMRLVDVLAEQDLFFTSVFLVTLDGYLVVDDVDPLAVRMAQGDTGALGYAFLGLHAGTGRLCYEVAVNAAGPFRSADIHRAAMDSTGPSVVTMTPPDPDTGTVGDCVLVETALLREIEADPSAFSVDVHSEEFPRGVVRGQVGTSHRAVTLSGAFVADDSGDRVRFGRGETGASGVAVMQIDARNGRLCGYLTTDATGPFLGAHIHAGGMDATGPDVLDLVVPADATGEAGGCVSADPALLSEIVDNSESFYVSVRTEDHPAGAVRSQLDSGTLGIPMSGAFVIDADGQPGAGEPEASGTAWLQADFDTGFTCFWIATDATGPFLVSNIIRAGPGENGPVVVSFPGPDDATGEISGCQQVDPDLLAETGHVERFAFEILTELFPEGAVRGQFSDGLLF